MMIIAIDGPAGTGKSTISKLVAQRLGLTYVDTGAIYRTLALISIERGISLEDETRVSEISTDFPIRFKFMNGINHVFFQNRDISEQIRTPEISMASSKVSLLPKVRAALLDLQRKLGRESDSILEGRDIGTVIFPNADYKFFLNASEDVRAQRRYNELSQKQVKVDYNEIKAQTIARDKQDSERKTAPLKKAADAIEIDTSNMNIDEVVETILSYIRKK